MLRFYPVYKESRAGRPCCGTRILRMKVRKKSRAGRPCHFADAAEGDYFEDVRHRNKNQRSRSNRQYSTRTTWHGRRAVSVKPQLKQFDSRSVFTVLQS